MNSVQFIDLGTRYPITGLTKATGENIIELAYGRSGVKVRIIEVVVTGHAVVKVNGQVLNGQIIKRESGRESKEYHHKHEVNALGQISGGISSLTIEGDAEFYVVCMQ